MSQSSKYLDYLHYNLNGRYPIIWREYRFYFGIWSSATGTYYIKPMKTKIGLLIHFRNSFIRWNINQERSSSKHILIFAKNLTIKLLRYIQLKKT